MEPHAIPRQITTFEFKLIGFLTLKQFLYLVVFTGFGVALYLGFPLPLINILLAGSSISLGAALAFLPINDRPLDVWITNFFNRLLQPSQYYFHKTNEPPAFMNGLFLTNHTTAVANHIDATNKLKNYTQSKEQKKIVAQPAPAVVAQQVSPLPPQSVTPVVPTPVVSVEPVQPVTQSIPTSPRVDTSVTIAPPVSNQKAFLSGIVVNSKNTPVVGVLVYIKGENGQVLRILKSNHSGQIATFHPLEKGSYVLEMKDPAGKYFFDTMKLQLENEVIEPLHIISKEIL